MGSQPDSAFPSPCESVMVVMDANRPKASVDALDWAIKHLVRPKDKVVVLGVLSELGKRPSCFPFNMGIGMSSIWVRLEFSGQGEMTPREVEEEIAKKKEEYQCTLHPFHRYCRKNEVKLEVKLAAGYDPRQITVEEAKNYHPRWIVLDSHLKRERVYIYGHVACNIAIMKGKGFATLMGSKVPTQEKWPTDSGKIVDVSFAVDETEKMHEKDTNASLENYSHAPPQSPYWYPLAWRTGFPRAFSTSELKAMTNGFADEDIMSERKDRKIYEGIYQEMPLLIICFSGDDGNFWSLLKILSRVRHRNILNLVGYCCTEASTFLLFDYPSGGNLEAKLRCDEFAMSFPWKSRWNIALEIGSALRYLHEECVDGPIVGVSLCSSCVVFSHGSSAMLCVSYSASYLMDEVTQNEGSPAGCLTTEEDERFASDIRAYGTLLVELITGKSCEHVHCLDGDQSLVNWALPLLEAGSPGMVMLDPRLTDASDATVVQYMASAALLCLKNDSGHKISISKALAAVRGDQFAF